MKYLSPVNCFLCGEDDFKIIFASTLTPKDFSPKVIREDLKNTLGDYKKHSRIVKCDYCGLVYTNPMEDVKRLNKGYEDVIDQEYIETESFRKLLSLEHLENIKRFKKSGNMLDIGCFAGFFLELAKKDGWQAYGIEPSVWASSIAKKKNIKIVGKNIESVKLKQNFYDVITLWDVIEHLDNPGKIIEKCHSSLKKGGIIALGTPNIDSLVAKILRSHNPYILRMHLAFYSPDTLGKMLEKGGFTLKYTYSYGRTFPISYILQRLANKNVALNMLNNSLRKYPRISNKQVHLNIRDSFVIIAKK